MRPHSEQPHLPAGTGNIFSFAGFNALSFQMIVGSPMILYAKTLDASATTLGIIAGMLPVMVIFQIPAARFVDAAGYKRFVLSGWSVRTVFVGLMALVPLSADYLSTGTRLMLVLVLLAFFNLSRGISSCGWLPWITSIIPAARRGRFLTRESATVNFAAFVALWLAAFLLGLNPEPWQFACLFFLSAICGAVSLFFLRRIPEEVRIESQKPRARPGLKEMLSERPFRRLLEMNVVWAFAYGGVMTFLVVWLKTVLDWPERNILMLISAVFLGALLNQLLLARILDRFGSRPVLISGMILWMVLLGTWSVIAGGVLAPLPSLAVVLMLAIGMAGSMVNLANIKLAMISVPEIGRSHYFAVYSVVGSVSLGVAPVVWGMLLDATSGISRMLGTHFELNSWSLLFGLLALLFVIAFGLCIRLEETRSVRWEALMRFAMRRARTRFWLRPWTRMMR